MLKLGMVFGILFVSTSVFAQEIIKTTVSDVTAFAPAPTPPPLETDGTTSDDTKNGIDLGKIIALGEKIWDFIISNKPSADYNVLKTSVVPAGITHWTQLQKWSMPVSKVYHVEFTNMFGGSAGGFDYRITYFHSGSYQGKGKFLGQISVVPTNINLRTDRTLKMNVELTSVLNFGTETDPVAGALITINWSSPTTTRYEMQSAEYLILGSGELQDLTNGN